MTKNEILANLANVADCKMSFANDCKMTAKCATEKAIEFATANDLHNVTLPLYIGNCNTNKKSILLACAKLNIKNVEISAAKKRDITITFDNTIMHFTAENCTITNECELATKLRNMFFVDVD